MSLATEGFSAMISVLPSPAGAAVLAVFDDFVRPEPFAGGLLEIVSVVDLRVLVATVSVRSMEFRAVDGHRQPVYAKKVRLIIRGFGRQRKPASISAAPREFKARIRQSLEKPVPGWCDARGELEFDQCGVDALWRPAEHHTERICRNGIVGDYRKHSLWIGIEWWNLA